jgi:hypothetical protein
MCPKNTTIYHAGDIGWDIYFIGGGLVKVQLPKNLSILDEEGRANIERTRDKATSLGLLYKAGNHFGESCLESITGVRRESTIASTVVKLHLLSKESLDEIFTYTPWKERNQLRRGLLSRNGNVWHSFDEEELRPKPLALTSGRSGTRNSFLTWTKPQRMSVVQKRGNETDKTIRQTERKEVEKPAKPRLRSFSAEASTRVLLWNKNREEQKKINDSLAILHEHEPIDAAQNRREPGQNQQCEVH